MKFLKNLQKLELRKRKIIYWILVILVSVLLFFVWLRLTIPRFRDIGKDNFFDSVKEPPEIEMLEIEIPSIPTSIIN